LQNAGAECLVAEPLALPVREKQPTRNIAFKLSNEVWSQQDKPAPHPAYVCADHLAKIDRVTLRTLATDVPSPLLLDYGGREKTPQLLGIRPEPAGSHYNRACS
jgi:hypothetical protein